MNIKLAFESTMKAAKYIVEQQVQKRTGEKIICKELSYTEWGDLKDGQYEHKNYGVRTFLTNHRYYPKGLRVDHTYGKLESLEDAIERIVEYIDILNLYDKKIPGIRMADNNDFLFYKKGIDLDFTIPQEIIETKHGFLDRYWVEYYDQSEKHIYDQFIINDRHVFLKNLIQKEQPNIGTHIEISNYATQHERYEITKEGHKLTHTKANINDEWTKLENKRTGVN